VTADMETSIRASRRRVARSRGALSGLLLVVLGLWAALVPFIGPYFNLAYTPQPNSAWHWTAARGWLEVLPGAAVFLGGLLLLVSASRAMTLFGGWLAALGGAWLVVGPPLANALTLNLGQPDPSMGTNARGAIAVLFFYATGAVILFFASLALGRVSVLSVRDVRAAERRAEAEAAERQAAVEAATREQEEARLREQEEARLAGRHAERHEDAAAARGVDERGVERGVEERQVEDGRQPQYAGGPHREHPYATNGTTNGQPPAPPATTPYGQPHYAGGQYQGNNPGEPYRGEPPTTQYPSAPPPRE